MTPEDAQKIVDKLKSVGAFRGACARCSSEKFDVIGDGYVMLDVDAHAQDPKSAVMRSGFAMPCVAVCCTQCGAISLHSSIRLDGSVAEAAAAKPEP